MSDSRSKPIGRDREDGLGAEHESGGAKQSPNLSLTSSPTDPIREALIETVADAIRDALPPIAFKRAVLRDAARAAISSMPTIAGDEERARIVAWLRAKVNGFYDAAERQREPVGNLAVGYAVAADCIERGDHLLTLSPEHIRRGE